MVRVAERSVPEPIEIGAQRPDPVGIDLIEATRARGPVHHQAGLLQHPEMLGDRGATHGQPRGELDHCPGTVHQALDPAFASDVPYAAVIVELDEGPRLATWVTGISAVELRLGMPLEVWFDAIAEDIALPKFRPSK